MTRSAFICTVEDLERSVTLQQIPLYIDSGMTQHDTVTSRTFLKVTLQKVLNENLWSTFMSIQTSDLPFSLSDTLPAKFYKPGAVIVFFTLTYVFCSFLSV